MNELLAKVCALLGLGKPLSVVVGNLGLVVLLIETFRDQRIMAVW